MEVKPIFSREEAQSLLNLIDVAVKAVGLNAALAGHVLGMRVKDAMVAAAEAAPANDEKAEAA